VAGPLFFGAAHKAMGALTTVNSGVRVVVLDLTRAPALDATGLANLDSALQHLHATGVSVILGGLGEQPYRALLKAGWRNRPGEVALRRSPGKALELARKWLGDGDLPADPV